MVDVVQAHAALHNWIKAANAEGLFPLTGDYLIGRPECFERKGLAAPATAWRAIAAAHDDIEPVDAVYFERIVLGKLGEEEGTRYVEWWDAVRGEPCQDLRMIFGGELSAGNERRTSASEATIFVAQTAQWLRETVQNEDKGIDALSDNQGLREEWAQRVERLTLFLLETSPISVSLPAIGRLINRTGLADYITYEAAPTFRRARELVERRALSIKDDPIRVVLESNLARIEPPGGVFDDDNPMPDETALAVEQVRRASATYPDRARVLNGLETSADRFQGLPKALLTAFAQDLALHIDQSAIDLKNSATINMPVRLPVSGSIPEVDQLLWEVDNADAFVESLPDVAKNQFYLTAQKLSIGWLLYRETRQELAFRWFDTVSGRGARA